MAVEELMQMSDFELAARLRSLMLDASDGDAQAQETLEQLVRSCDNAAWQTKPRFCSAVTSALIQTGTHRSMLFVMRFLREIPASVPFGAVEMIAAQLPIYGGGLLPTLRNLAQSQEEASRALGIQTLCNMYLERRLPPADEEFLREQIEHFEDDRFATGHVAEIVRAEMKAKAGEADRFLEELQIGL